MGAYALCFAVSALVAYGATYGWRKLAVRIGALDHGGERHVHDSPVPTAGGVAMYAGFAVGLGVASLMPTFHSLFHDFYAEPVGILVAATLVMALGVLDDTRGVTAAGKMAGLVLGGGVLVMSGIQVLFFWVPFVGVISLSPELAAPFTIGVMLVMANAVNLIDGLDGLAAGVVGIAALAFFFYTYQTDVSFGFAAPSSAALVSILVAGACVGFLPHNFNPARVFMGDTGALMLGTILAAATVSAIGRSTAPSAADMAAVVAPVVIPLLILGIPIADTVFAVLRRARGGKPVTHADRAHIHHRLLELGHSHRRAVLILYAWTALFSAASLGLSIPRARGILYASLMVGVGAGVYLLGPRAGKAWAKRG